MSNRKSIASVSVLIVLLVLSLFVGCAKPPTEEMQKAAQQIAAAEKKEANIYATELFDKASQALRSAEELVKGRKYDEAKKAAGEAIRLADQAAADVEAAKAKMRAEAELILGNIQKEMETLKSQVVTAIKRKAPVNREEVQAAIGKWEVDLTTARGQLQEGKIRDARDLLLGVQKLLTEQTASIGKALEAAVVVPEKKKR